MMKNTVICWDKASLMWLQGAYREGKKHKYDKSANGRSLYVLTNTMVKFLLAKETQGNCSLIILYHFTVLPAETAKCFIGLTDINIIPSLKCESCVIVFTLISVAGE